MYPDELEEQESTMKPGEKVGKYEIRAVLGSGSMGTVYKAYDLVLGRFVGLKTIKSDQINEKQCHNFIKEARNMAQCSHENIIEIYEINMTPLPYIVMEYIEGKTLQEWAERLNKNKVMKQKEKEKQIINLFIKLGDALQEVHRREKGKKEEVWHLDIKPGNIMVTAKGEPKLMDFGISHMLREFQEGTIAGTPHYMAPEQVSGKPSKRSDIYALGATLYQCLVGIPPFDADSVMRLMYCIVRKYPSTLREVKPDLDVNRDIEAICLKCLNKKPTKRYINAAQFSDELRNFLANKPILAKKLNLWQSARLFAIKHQRICAFLALAIMSTIISTTLAITISSQNAIIAKQNFDLQEKDTRNSTLLIQNHCYLGLVYEEKQNYSDALLEYEEAIKIMKAKNIPYAKVYSDRASLFTEAPDYLHQIRKEKKGYLTYQQEQDFEEAIKIDPHYAKVFYNMGRFYEKKEDIRKAMEHYAKVVECDFDLSKTYQTDKETELSKGKTQKEHNKTMFKAYFNRGNILYKQKKFTEAIADYTKAIKYNSTHYEIYFNRYSCVVSVKV